MGKEDFTKSKLEKLIRQTADELKEYEADGRVECQGYQKTMDTYIDLFLIYQENYGVPPEELWE